MLRNIFDQYNHPENRLSHALAVCLHEDRHLLGRFLERVGVKPSVRAWQLAITEQGLPGEAPETEEEAERKGLPDIVIHDGAAWCLLIESKIQARLTDDQLTRHERTLRRRGFERVHRLALTKGDVRHVQGTTALAWSELYDWLGTSSLRSRDWPERLRSYLRAAEVRLANEAYLTEGTLTMFDGFPFSSANPYTYGEAKRLLKLAMAELRKNRSLKALGIDSKAPGRGAITGRRGSYIWDFLSLIDGRSHGAFTVYPHLTLSVHTDGLEAALTIPNGVIGPIRRKLVGLGPEGLIAVNAEILRRSRSLLSRGGFIQAYAEQRHFSGRRTVITDARIRSSWTHHNLNPLRGVKRQREWVWLFAELLDRKRSNIQFGYQVCLPWATKGIESRESLRLIAESWGVLQPLLDAVRK